MSRQSQASSISNRSIRTTTQINIGTVIDVITNEEHPTIKDTGVSSEVSDTRNVSNIGAVKLRRLDDITADNEQLVYYLPLDFTTLDLPVIGETVEIWRSNKTSNYGVFNLLRDHLS